MDVYMIYIINVLIITDLYGNITQCIIWTYRNSRKGVLEYKNSNTLIKKIISARKQKKYIKYVVWGKY